MQESPDGAVKILDDCINESLGAISKLLLAGDDHTNTSIKNLLDQAGITLVVNHVDMTSSHHPPSDVMQ